MSMSWIEATAKKYGVKVERGKRGSVVITFPSEDLQLTLTQKKAFKLFMWLHLHTIAPSELKNTWEEV